MPKFPKLFYFPDMHFAAGLRTCLPEKRQRLQNAEQTDEINSVGLFFIIFMRCKCVNSLVV